MPLRPFLPFLSFLPFLLLPPGGMAVGHGRPPPAALAPPLSSSPAARRRALLSARRSTESGGCTCAPGEYFSRSKDSCFKKKKKTSDVRKYNSCMKSYNNKWAAIQSDDGSCSQGCKVCQEGHACSGGVHSVADHFLCPPGRYSESAGSTTCAHCDPGQYSEQTGSSDRSDCVQCETAYYCPGGSDRVVCAPGTYSDEKGRVNCTLCEPGYSCKGFGYTCSTYMGCWGKKACAPGRYSDEAGEQTLPEEYPCKKCGSGQYQDETTSTGCKSDCPVGSYVPDPDKISCIKCEAGRYINYVGLSSCSICPTGTFQHQEGQTSCIENCSAGHGTEESDRTACLPCPEGTFSAAVSLSTCTTCPSGQYQDQEGETACKSDCLAGSYIPVGARSCTQCAPGEHSTVNGTTNACLACGHGQYQWQVGQTSCIENCSAGHGTEESDRTACLPCPEGTFSAAVSLSTCTTCPPGQYQDQEGETACKSDCPAGSYIPADRSSCVMCAPGRFTSTSDVFQYQTETNSPCEDCPTGQYQNLVGQPACNENCSAGHYIPQSTRGLSCIACPAGFSQPGPDAPHGACPVCPAGRFQDNEGQAACVPCPSDTYGTTVNARRDSLDTGCLACPIYWRRGTKAYTYTFGRNGTDSVDSCFSCTPSGDYSSCTQCTVQDVCTEIVCWSGYADVNGDPTDGCDCTDDYLLMVKHGNCTECTIHRGCTSVACDDGFFDGNRRPRDGCEATISTARKVGLAVSLKNMAPETFNENAAIVRAFVDTVFSMLADVDEDFRREQIVDVRACAAGIAADACPVPTDDNSYNNRKRLLSGHGSGQGTSATVHYRIAVGSDSEATRIEEQDMTWRTTSTFAATFQTHLRENNVLTDAVVATPMSPKDGDNDDGSGHNTPEGGPRGSNNTDAGQRGDGGGNTVSTWPILIGVVLLAAVISIAAKLLTKWRQQRASQVVRQEGQVTVIRELELRRQSGERDRTDVARGRTIPMALAVPVPNVRSSRTPSATAVCVEQDVGTSKTTTDLERCFHLD